MAKCHWRQWLYTSGLLLLLACQDTDDDLGAVYPAKDRGITQLTHALDVLRKAHSQGKVIEMIRPMFGGKSGWDIFFTDSTTISLLHGDADGDDLLEHEPSAYFYVSEDSLWMPCRYDMSDNGDTRTASLHVKNIDGLYSYADSLTAMSSYSQEYYHSKPLVACIVEDIAHRTLTVTMANGEAIVFKKHYTSVQGVEWASGMPVSIAYGDTVALEFSVTPWPALLGSASIEAPGMTLCGVRSLYDGPNGRYEALLTVDRSLPADMPLTTYTKLMLTQSDTLSSSTLSSLPAEADTLPHPSPSIATAPLRVDIQPQGTATPPRSGLPVIYIDTPGARAITSKTEWTEQASLTIYRPDGTVDSRSTTGVKGRGNSTWGYPKLPYTLKLQAAQPLLDMPADRHWVLLANWIDRTLMRNDIAFALARAIDMEWVPRGQFVELMMNGRYQGNYYLCEQVRVAPHRVNIEEMMPTDTVGAALTGGYLLELDQYFDEPNKFFSANRQMPYMLKSPDEATLSTRQLDYIRNYVNSMEAAMGDSLRFAAGEHRRFIDMESFAKYWLVQQLTTNYESGDPKSVFLYKPLLSKMKAGPVWDFDYATFVPSAKDFIPLLYYSQLLRDPVFVAAVKAAWRQARPALADVVSTYIPRQAHRLAISEAANHQLWPITMDFPAGDEQLTFTQAVQRLQQALADRMTWLDQRIREME